MLFPAGAGSVLATAVGFETNRGNCYRCVATTRAEPAVLGAAGVRRLAVEKVQLERRPDDRQVELALMAKLEPALPE